MVTVLLLGFALQNQETFKFLDPAKLPKFGASTSKIVKPVVVQRPPNSSLELPKGFKASVFAKGLKSPRWLLTLPNGDILCVECYQGKVLLLKDKDGDNVAETNIELVTKQDLPFGLAYKDGYLYVANTSALVRFPYTLGEEKVSGPAEELTKIPALGYNMHWTRNIIFSPDGKKLYLSVGSETNRDVEKPPRACIMVMDPDGKNQKVYASGIRNPVGLAFRPGTNELWMTCVERDYMGDDLVPDYITQVKQDQFYGWPWYYIGKNRDPRIPLKDAPKTPVTIPDVLVTSHSVPLGMTFYTGKKFPAKYQGDLFVAMRGSTNRRVMAGYQVIRIDFENGKRNKGYYTFAEGWIPDRKQPNVYGRPVGLTQTQDGDLLVADEGAGLIWRITYEE